LVLEKVSNSSSKTFQTVGIKDIQCQFRIPPFNIYIQTLPLVFFGGGTTGCIGLPNKNKRLPWSHLFTSKKGITYDH
jgi:hypothetical protein